MKTCQSERRGRLHKFVDLARVYRGWNKSQISAALGRDPTKLVPESGNPKLDLVVALADALDWTVGDVAEGLWCRNGTGNQECAGKTFKQLDKEALVAHRNGEYRSMTIIAEQMAAMADGPEQIAIACNRAAGAWDGQGRYTRVLESIQQGLSQLDISPSLQLMLQGNLANAHYMLWHLFEARATAHELLEQFSLDPPQSRLEKVTYAFAHYVRGNCHRRMIEGDDSEAICHARSAREDLQKALESYENLAQQFDDESYRGIAHTCRGALLEVEVALGLVKPVAAIRRINDMLNGVIDVDAIESGDWLESHGWWCVFGCNIALRGSCGDDQHRIMAVFSNKAIEIAEKLDNWSLRERAFTMEHFRRQRVSDAVGVEIDWILDDEEVRVIAGTMGRFPTFRETGWQILETSNALDMV